MGNSGRTQRAARIAGCRLNKEALERAVL